MHCGVTSLQLTLTPCFAQTSKQLAGRAARREAHLPLSALTEPNQVLWAQEVPRKCSCLSGHLWSLRRWDQSTTSPSQEASVLPSPPRSTKDFEPDSWVCVCSPLPTASLALWQGSGNGFRVRVFNRRWVKKIDWANLRIKKKKRASESWTLCARHLPFMNSLTACWWRIDVYVSIAQLRELRLNWVPYR